MADFVFLALVALLIEACVGYPDWLWRTIGHPVSWIGRIIDAADRRFNVIGLSAAQRRLRGGLCLGALLIIVAGVSLFVQVRFARSLAGFAVLVVLASTLFAQRSLHKHVAAVADGLDRGLQDGRAAVGAIVGRDVSVLDAAGVARAAIESLAENFADGVVAPVLWTAIAGLPGGAVYKAINTADSMIGHRTARHVDFGMPAARIDDLVNWPAARLAGLLIVAAALLRRRVSAKRAWTAMWRDASKHRSPNAGWPEAAMAGALGLQLAGPRVYDGIRVVDAIMGDGRRDATAQDIRAALSLYRRTVPLVWMLLAFVIWLLV